MKYVMVIGIVLASSVTFAQTGSNPDWDEPTVSVLETVYEPTTDKPEAFTTSDATVPAVILNSELLSVVLPSQIKETK